MQTAVQDPFAHATSAANIERFRGFAARYDAARPAPPLAIPHMLMQLAQTSRPRLVVDLGSGTGLSTVIWAPLADAVIGVEPGADMRRQAQVRTAALPDSAHVTYREAVAAATGLPAQCADIVTCSQALHWMTPAPTLAEVGRILRPGGVFAAYDNDWPPVVAWEAEAAYNRCLSRALHLGHARQLFGASRSWDKEGHLARMEASGHFRYCREVLIHHQEMGNAERLVAVALSQGSVATLLKAGLSEDEIGITSLRAVAQRTLGDTPAPWLWSYRVRVGIR
ncbi:MAG: class I SAM-dependent methyltransferase [Anaerolineae bacterium]|nr:class I SAM-dependent methyltransferase [Anaerolineae bacterium]